MANNETKWTIGAILTWTKQYFSEKGVDNPRLDAEVLLCHILGKDRLYLYVHFEQPLESDELAAFRTVVKKRVQRIPVAYIIGRKEFMNLDFSVSPDVLIPRPDTEILVEAVLEKISTVTKLHILDIGTGSGAIIVSLLSRLPAAGGTAVDISPAALAVAQGNAVKHRVNDRLNILQGDVFQPVHGRLFDVIVSNPPYIIDADIAALAPEVQKEPRLALAGGKDGLDFYRRLVAEGPAYLKPDGFMALEVGQGQAARVAELANAGTDIKSTKIIKDYAGIERVIILEKVV